MNDISNGSIIADIINRYYSDPVWSGNLAIRPKDVSLCS